MARNWMCATWIMNKYLKATSTEKNVATQIYQRCQFYNKEFAFALNVVIILENQLADPAQRMSFLSAPTWSKTMKKSSVLCLGFHKIEFNFRDAKQYWVSGNFMNIKEKAVTNAAICPYYGQL